MKKIAVAIDFEWAYRRHHDVYAGIQAYAEQHHANDWQLMPDNFPGAILTGKMRGPNYNAVIGRLSPELQDVVVDCGVPAVNVWIGSSAHGKVPSVLSDVAAGARMVVEHFAARGIRRIAHVGVRGDVACKLETAAMKAVTREHGFLFSDHRCPAENETDLHTWRSFCRRVDGWLKRWEPPLGVFCHYDAICRQLSAVMMRAGWQIPDQVCLVGSGNNTIICESISPALSSVHPGYRQVGYQAAKLLDAQMRGEPMPSEPILIPPLEIAMRRSTDVFAVPDPSVAAALRYMAENCNLCLNVNQVAARVGVGRRTLERRFRAVLGRSIIQELNRLRVERMKRFLIETEDPVKGLVSQAGFGSAEQMRLVFREVTGMTPRKFREQHHSRRS
jgi:LacI family transcriptional regulator